MPNFGCSKFLPVFLHQNGSKNIKTPNFCCSKFLVVFFCTKKDWKKFGMAKLGIPNFLHQNNKKKFGMAKIGCCKCFAPKRLNHFGTKRLEEIQDGQIWFPIFSTILVQKDCKKLGMHKIRCSKFFHTIFAPKTLEEIWNGQNGCFKFV